MKYLVSNVLLASVLLVSFAVRASDEDAFLAGFATAVLKRDLGLADARVTVEGGVAKVEIESFGSVQPQQVADAVARIEGIEKVEVSAEVPGEQVLQADAESVTGAAGSQSGVGIEFLPRRELFDPLLADPRQPRFSASYAWYLDDPELGDVGSANFGETFALAAGPLLDEARWEIGILGGVYSIFDLDAPSSDLINSDFLAGITLSTRWDVVSAQLRVFHQSSHLGDEFLLRDRARRVNLSYEAIDLFVSLDVHPALRLYVGGGRIVRDEPNLEPYSGQAGVELESPYTLFDGVIRPIASADFQFREENDWEEEISANAGLQIENPEISPIRVQILAEYFRGNSPNGQFFERRIEYIGVGAHLHF